MKYNKDAVILKHGLGSRLYHWALVLGFLPAALTGIILWLKPGGEDLVNLAMRIHIAGAWIFTVATVIYGLFCFERVVAFVRSIFTWTKDDIEWLKLSGGYPQKILFGKTVEVPPMGKMNSGQKLFGVCLFFGSLLLLLTGWILYAFLPMTPKEIALWANKIHLVVGLFLTAFLCGGHIVLALYNWRECVCMFGDGTITVEAAMHHNKLWVEEELEAVGGEEPTVPAKSA